MIRSMTGFGRSQVEDGAFAVRIEVRTVNNRNLRTAFRMPEKLLAIESDLEKTVRKVLSRGTVNVYVNIDETSGDPGYAPDADAIRFYRENLAALCRDLNLDDDVTLQTLITLPGAIKKVKDAGEISEDLIKEIRSGLDAALAEVVSVREKEGAFIWADMTSRCDIIETLVKRVVVRAPVMVDEYRRRLSERLAKLLEGVGCEVTDDDVRREIALFADRSDISEEVARLGGHIEMMRALASEEEPCGRKLEFMTQEMFREANTMGSKANDPDMVRDILDIKAEVEKLREQALNVE